MPRAKKFNIETAKNILGRLEALAEMLGPYDGKFIRKGDLAETRKELCAAADKIMGSDIPYDVCFSGYLDKKRVTLAPLRANIARLKGMVEVFELHKDAPAVLAYQEAVVQLDACRKTLIETYGSDQFRHMVASGLLGDVGYSIRYVLQDQGPAF